MKKKTKQLIANSLSEAINPGNERKSTTRDLLGLYQDKRDETGYTDTPGYTGYTDTTDTTNPSSKEETQSTGQQKKTSGKIQPISPIRDFSKIPNSLTRDVLAKGLFKGKSKQIYDYLWSVSRGAIRPTRTIQKTHKDIMKGAGIGSRNTVVSGVKHLKDIGLIDFISSVGTNDGNTYQINSPEELGYTSLIDTTDTTDTTGLSQKVVIPVIPETGYTDTTQISEKKGSYSPPKTFFKDSLKPDDETLNAFIPIFEKFAEASKKLTGKLPAGKDAAAWEKLADLLIGELEKAAERTEMISNIPAFLTEVLRRKLFANFSRTDQKNTGNKNPKIEGKSGTGKNPDKTFKDDLAYLTEIDGDEESIADYKKWFDEESWNNLIKEFEKLKRSN